MAVTGWLTTSLLILHTSQAYILLTANMEDVQSIVNQLASATVVDKVQGIWQRASNLFQQQLDESERRRSGIDTEVKKDIEPHTPAEGSAADGGHDDMVESLIALGKNASVYIKSIKSALESNS